MQNYITHLTEQICNIYIANKKESGSITGSSCAGYRKTILSFLEFLPNTGELNQESVAAWQEYLIAYGYMLATVNSKTSIINGLLVWCGRKDLVLNYKTDDKKKESTPEITREEYIQLLRTAKKTGNMRRYCLVRIFGSTPVSVGEVPLITVEAVEKMRIVGSGRGRIDLPALICKELRRYVENEGITTGSIFITSKGTPYHRTHINAELYALAKAAGIDKRKVAPRALKKIYTQTIEEVARRVAMLAGKELEDILEEDRESADDQC